MIKTKKQMFLIIASFVLVILLGTTTYAFFNYTRTGTANIIKTGRIYFSSEQGTAINLENLFPIDPTETGIMNDATKVGTVTINVKGDTTYSDGIEYLVSAVNVQNSVGNKSLPISIDISYSANGNGKVIGTEDEEYFDNRGGNTSIYKVLTNNTISNNGELVVGYIARGATGIDGNIVIKAYIDRNKVAISDTYPEGDVTHTEGVEPNQTTVTDYTNGTTDEWVGDRETFTTTEWNSLQSNGVSFQVKVEANEGTWVDEPHTTITYFANGGTVNVNTKNIPLTSVVYGELIIPVYEGHVFDGWYTDVIGGTIVTENTPYNHDTSPKELYAHWIIIPTTMEEMCPDCIYTYYNFCENHSSCGLYSTWNNKNNPAAKITDLDVVYSDYEDAINASRASIFLGLVVNDSDEIEKVYVCGVSKTLTPFCLNGTTDESGDNLNRAILSSVGCVNNNCYDDAHFIVASYGVSAYLGSVGCGINRSNGYFQCYDQ